jgi:hypothetical protein
MIRCGSISLKAYIATLLFFASLLCMKFDYSNNIIILGSLQLYGFEKAQILYYKNSGVTPRQQLALILGKTFDALMLKTPMLIQAYIFQIELHIELVVLYSY